MVSSVPEGYDKTSAGEFASSGRSDMWFYLPMSTFALIHGAFDVGWYWHLVAAELRARGHDTVAPDLPIDDDAAGLDDYATTVIDAIGARQDLVVVAQSFGGFTAPLVAARRPVDLLVLVAGMVPAPGEKGDDWPANTGLSEAIREQAARPVELADLLEGHTVG
jgi:pimeloyl-ACP methyl ester carboxylesterase